MKEQALQRARVLWNERLCTAIEQNRWTVEDTDAIVAIVAEELEAVAKESRAALIAAVKVIHTWHNLRYAGCAPGPGLSGILDEVWRLYWRNSPEMALIREALKGVNLDDPEGL